MKTLFGIFSAIVLLLSSAVMAMTFMDQRYVEGIAKQVIAYKIEAEIVAAVPALGDPDSKTSAAFRKTFGKLAGDEAEATDSGAETMVAIIERVIQPICLCAPTSIEQLAQSDAEAGRIARLRSAAVDKIRGVMAEVYQAKVEALLFKIRVIAGQMMAAGLLGLAMAVFGVGAVLTPPQFTALDIALTPILVLEILFFIGASIFAAFILSVGGWILIGLNCILLLIMLDTAFNEGGICSSLLDFG